MMLSGCQANISIGTNDTLTGETYPNAEKYQTGAFTYKAADIKAVEIYWRSRKVEITESDNIEFYVKESLSLYTSPSPRDRQKTRMPSSA